MTVKAYLSTWTGNRPSIQIDLLALPDIEIDGIFVPAWDSMQVADGNRPSVSGTNTCVVTVNAPQATHDTIGATYTYAGLPDDRDINGNLTVDGILYESNANANTNDERRRQHKVVRKLNRVQNLIARTEATIARKDGYRANREASRVQLVALKNNLQDIRDAVFIGVVEDIVTEVDTTFENTNNFREFVDDVEVKTPKVDCLQGIRDSHNGLINLIIRADNGINTRIANHVAEKQRLIDEIAALQLALDGVLPDGGSNLITVELALESELAGYG